MVHIIQPLFSVRISLHVTSQGSFFDVGHIANKQIRKKTQFFVVMLKITFSFKCEKSQNLLKIVKMKI